MYFTKLKIIDKIELVERCIKYDVLFLNSKINRWLDEYFRPGHISIWKSIFDTMKKADSIQNRTFDLLIKKSH